MTSSITLEKQRKCIEDFFYDESDLPWIPLLGHTFERSPCKVIIPQMILGSSNPGYYCKLHLKICYSINLDTIEHHHYKYKEPEKHKSKLLEILNGGYSSK